jgi:hypothetical protein
MKNYSTSDKISVVLVWVLIQTVIGIAAIKVIPLCNNWAAIFAVCIFNFFASYFLSYKMSGEIRKMFNF